jgi:hypothetical protein
MKKKTKNHFSLLSLEIKRKNKVYPPHTDQKHRSLNYVGKKTQEVK